MNKILFCKLCNERTEHNIINECICNEDQGAGYTYQDEYGDCNYCLGKPARCNECNRERILKDILDGFDLPYQKYISDYEYKNRCIFVGCTESDYSLIFRKNDTLEIVDTMPDGDDVLLFEEYFSKYPIEISEDEIDFDTVSDEELDRLDV